MINANCGVTWCEKWGMIYVLSKVKTIAPNHIINTFTIERAKYNKYLPWLVTTLKKSGNLRIF